MRLARPGSLIVVSAVVSFAPAVRAEPAGNAHLRIVAQPVAYSVGASGSTARSFGLYVSASSPRRSGRFTPLELRRAVITLSGASARWKNGHLGGRNRFRHACWPARFTVPKGSLLGGKRPGDRVRVTVTVGTRRAATTVTLVRGSSDANTAGMRRASIVAGCGDPGPPPGSGTR